MELKPIKCPSCGADLQVPDNKDFIVCPYCNTTVQVRDEIKVSYDVNINNLLKLADEDLGAGNFKEAYAYYNKVLEANADSPDGWLGKGVCAGYLLGTGDFQIEEMLKWIQIAIEKCSEGNVNQIKEIAAKHIDYIVMSHFNQNTPILSDYTSWILAMEYAQSYLPQDKTILHNLILVCKQVLIVQKSVDLNSKIINYENELKQIDPSYNPSNDKIVGIPAQTNFQDQTMNTSILGKRALSRRTHWLIYFIVIIMVLVFPLACGLLQFVCGKK
jgi:tetratricopeptide (TPR) repeat protein